MKLKQLDVYTPRWNSFVEEMYITGVRVLRIYKLSVTIVIKD